MSANPDIVAGARRQFLPDGFDVPARPAGDGAPAQPHSGGELPRPFSGGGPAALARAGRLLVRLARGADEIEAAQRLRWQVFAGELGAALDSPAGIDRDIFDPWCEHLVAVDCDSGEVVGTYRLLMPQAAARLGCLYADGEFWLTRLDPLRGRIVELGRSCVRADHRSGPAIMLLWSGLGALLARSDARYLIGCVSVPIADGGRLAANLYRRLSASCMADVALQVWPHERLPIERFEPIDEVAPPPLLKAYLRAGAQLLGEPHMDLEFGCADFPMLLRLDSLKAGYQRRFLGEGRPPVATRANRAEASDTARRAAR